MRVMVVEDDERIADFLMRALNAEGHTCTGFSDGASVVDSCQDGDFDVIILDLMLPGMNGLDVCSALRMRQIRTPIIMLTALDSVEDVVQGLRLGADDYMSKPFEIDELLARMETVTRRHRSQGANNDSRTLSVGNVTLNRESKLVHVDSQPVALTAKEIAILELFLANPSRLYSRERILVSIWGSNVDPLTNVVDVYVGRLRKKLGKDKEPFIETVRGLGYRIHPDVLGERLPGEN